MKFTILFCALLSFFCCNNDLLSNKQLVKKEIISLIFTDFAIQDSTLSYSAILEIKTSNLIDDFECHKNIGVINSNNSDTINEMYGYLYGCQRNFELTYVQVPEYIRKQGHLYCKIDFYAIQPYYDIPMMVKLHREYLESEISVLFFSNPLLKFTKSNKFKIRAFQYEEEVSINDEQLKSVW